MTCTRTLTADGNMMMTCTRPAPATEPLTAAQTARRDAFLSMLDAAADAAGLTARPGTDPARWHAARARKADAVRRLEDDADLFTVTTSDRTIVDARTGITVHDERRTVTSLPGESREQRVGRTYRLAHEAADLYGWHGAETTPAEYDTAGTSCVSVHAHDGTSNRIVFTLAN